MAKRKITRNLFKLLDYLTYNQNFAFKLEAKNKKLKYHKKLRQHVYQKFNYYRKSVYHSVKEGSIAVLLVVLFLNTLSSLLRKMKGYSYGGSMNQTLTRKFFADNLKLYISPFTILKKQLDLETTFSKDTGIKFSQSKCAYTKIEKDKTLQQHQQR